MVKAIAQRESESTLESIQRLTKGIQTEFNSLTGDSSTYREVHILESLDLDRIAEAIKSIDDVNIDVDQRWTLAIGFSNLVCSMIHVADGMYGKLVNGSAGKFCPDTVWLLEDTLWKDLVKTMIEETLLIVKHAYHCLLPVPGRFSRHRHHRNPTFFPCSVELFKMNTISLV